MQVGISTFDLENPDFQTQVHSLLEQGVQADFILLHYGGFLGKYIKMYRFLLKTIRQYRFQTISQLRKRTQSKSSKNVFSLTDEQRKKVRTYIAGANIIKVFAINDSGTINKLKQFGETLLICNSGILKERVLALKNIVFINIHASRLPKYRGMNNVEWALYENQELYVTIHRISRGIDEGDILYQEKVETQAFQLGSIADYRNCCFFAGNKLVGKAIALYLQGKIDFLPQEITGSVLDQYYVMHPLLKQGLEEKL